MISKLDALTQDVFHDNLCRTWRRNGQTKTWKRDTNRFRVPVKYGLYRYGAVTDDNAYLVHVPGADGCHMKDGR